MNDTATRTSNQDEIRLKEILQSFWHYKTLALVLIVGTTLVTYIVSFFVPKEYEAVVVIAPVAANTNNQAGAIGSLSNNLAALAGVPMTSDPKKIESIAVLQSEQLTERYIQENNLLPILYPRKWDSARSRWKSSKPDDLPTLWKANRFFKKEVRSIATDPKTGLVTVTITWDDPLLAARWANGLVRMTNDAEQATAITESERNIAYLSGEALKTDVIGIKQAIYSILEEEYSKAMLAKGNSEYAFRVIDRAVPPEKPSYPDKLVWVLTAIFASLSVYLFVSFCIVAWSKM